jgi:hypothetical protein
MDVYIARGICREGHESIPPDQYFRIKRLIEEWKEDDESKQQAK